MNQKIKKIIQKMQENQFSVFIILSLAIAGGLISLSLWLYSEGGTAQLDLSRPSYQEAREQQKREAAAEKEKQTKKTEFASEGSLDRKSVEQFELLYKDYLQKTEGDFYSENPLSDETLNLRTTEEN